MGKKSPSPPPPPDPVATAQAQAAANAEAVDRSYLRARIDEYGPGVTVNYLKGPDGQAYAKRTTLGPTQQALFDQSQNVALDLANRAGDLVSGVPTSPYSYSGLPDRVSNINMDVLPGIGLPNLQDTIDRSNSARDRVEQSLYDRSHSLINPSMEKSKRDLETNLRNRGFGRDSEAYRFEMDQLERSQNETRQRIADQAVAAGGAEASRIFGMDRDTAQFTNTARQNQFALEQSLRNQGLSEAQINVALQNQARQSQINEDFALRDRAFNEASAAVRGQAALPQHQLGNTGPVFGVNPANIQQATYASHNAALQNYNTQVQQANAAAQGFGSLFGSVIGLF